jgi:hypothetical protein
MYVLLWLLLASTAYAFILKMEAVCFSETAVNSYRSRRQHIPGDGNTFQETVKGKVIPVTGRGGF